MMIQRAIFKTTIVEIVNRKFQEKVPGTWTKVLKAKPKRL